MNKQLKNNFIVHLCKYLGIALVSGSIVHAGTLGGNTHKYIILIIVGILLTVYGNYLEHKVQNLKISKGFIILAVLLSFGTGMLSGGIQHYSDNPDFGSVLLSLGLLITFLAFAYKDFSKVISKKAIGIMAITSLASFFILSSIGNYIAPHNEEESDMTLENNH
jgi:hypothetical protein